jgi:hypothetical protein
MIYKLVPQRSGSEGPFAIYRYRSASIPYNRRRSIGVVRHRSKRPPYPSKRPFTIDGRLSRYSRTYLDTASLLTQVAPLVFVDDTFALKGGTAINLYVHDPRLHQARHALASLHFQIAKLILVAEYRQCGVYLCLSA